MISVDKVIWGPFIWSVMHIISTKYKFNRQSNLFNLIYKKYITSIIPCKECLTHYKSFINSQNISPTSFELNLYKFHDQVSVKIGKNTTSNYNLYHKEYSVYGLNEINIILNKLKNYYYRSGYINLGKNVTDFINFLNFNF